MPRDNYKQPSSHVIFGREKKRTTENNTDYSISIDAGTSEERIDGLTLSECAPNCGSEKLDLDSDMVDCHCQNTLKCRGAERRHGR